MKAPRTVISTALTLASIAYASPSLAATDFGAKGPEATTTANLPAGAATGGKLVTPNGAGPYPILVASHGFLGSSANQVGWAEHFASYGFVVAVPDFGGTDHVKNGDTIVTLVNDVATAVPKADKTRVGFEGHSAGGLASTLAAAKVKPGAVVLFDPVDNGGRGKTAFATLCSPTLVLFANAGQCNVNAEWKGFGPATSGPLTLATVVGASHCDGENAARALCGTPVIGCGAAASPARQTVHAKYAIAHFMAVLKNDADAKALLAEAALAGDSALSDTSVKGGAPCSGTTPGGDAGPGKDGGSTPIPTPTGTTPGTPGTPGTPNPGGSPSAQPEDGAATESGCNAGPGAASGSFGAVALGLAVGLVALGRARRRTR